MFGVFVFPNLYQLLKSTKEIYFYIFPLFMFLLRNIVQFGYWLIGYSENLYLQITLFLIGLEYGTVLTIPVGEIEFWYLIVFFSLQIINDPSWVAIAGKDGVMDRFNHAMVRNQCDPLQERHASSDKGGHI